MSSPSHIRYATSTAPRCWSGAGAGAAILDAIGAAAEDGVDRIVFAWPNGPGGAFVVAALALQRCRTSGSLAHATFGYWPWRTGASFAARSILVNSADLRDAASRAYTDLINGAKWADPAFAHEALALVELRLNDLLKRDSPKELGQERRDTIIFRSPTLYETTAVFSPGGPGGAPYVADPDQVLHRLRAQTRIGRYLSAKYLDEVGDPIRTPFALLGLPAAEKADDLHAYLCHERPAQHGLDVVVVDLTALARRGLSDAWEKPLATLIAALNKVPGRRPPVAVVVEDGHALRAAARVLRESADAMSPRRPPPVEVGVYMPEGGVIGSAAELPCELAPISFDPDIKDASLAPIRRGLLSLGKALRNDTDGGGAAAARALRFLQRIASLPIGLTEARHIADILHPGDNAADQAARAAFRPKMELAALEAVAERAPAFGAAARQLVAQIAKKVESWSDESPVSAKLTAVLDAADGRAGDTMVVVPSWRIREVFLSSDRARRWDCEVVAPDSLAERLAAVRPNRLIVVGASPAVARVLLTSPDVPRRVALIGDTAGVGLLISETGPITRMEAFRPLAERAMALQRALSRGGSDESLDLADAEFRRRVAIPEEETDFTHSGDAYQGDIVHLVTTRGGRFAYRPSGEVLVHLPGELRPFVATEARHVKKGDFILAMGSDVRETLRRALTGSRRVQQELATYHATVAKIREDLPGATLMDKARHVLARMRELQPSLPDSDLYNIRRWITADATESDSEGYRVPGAARDWQRFSSFTRAVGMPDIAAAAYWQGAVVRTRVYRAHEGHSFNQRVVQFVLDPEGTAIGAGVLASAPNLWHVVITAVDEIESVTVEHRGGDTSNG